MSTTDAAHKFWTVTYKYGEYEDLAKRYEQNIEVAQPDRVTSRSLCPCLDFCNYCEHPLEGNVTYYEYCGPNVGSL